MSPLRLTGAGILLTGFIAANFGPTGLLAATLLWLVGTTLFARSFLKK